MKTWQEQINEILVYVDVEDKNTVANLILDFLVEARAAGYNKGFDEACGTIRDFANEARRP